jgi:hypothetical protein
MKTIAVIMAAVVTLFAAHKAAAAKSQPPKNEVDKNIKQPETISPHIWAPAVKPKPLSESVKKGLQWLVEHQCENGGWSQGEESSHMGHSLDHLKDKPNVADTCAAALTLIRSGSTPATGLYAKNIFNAVNYVCSEVQKSDANSLFITSIRDTRLQMKLGTYIDTFLASLLFAEVTGKMPDAESEKMLAEAYNKVMDKIERNQHTDGTFGGTGWANALSISLASKGLNRAAQAGGRVNEKVRQRLETYARRKYDRETGSFSEEGSAGVQLYAGSASLSAMQDSDNTNAIQQSELEKKLENVKGSEEREQIQQTLQRFKQNRDDLEAAKKTIVDKLDDEKFIAGFGSNGGEEFLSYMNIGESLVVKGGPEWEKWDKEITTNLNRIQNNDGSWTGHHCITGRTFCTSASLLVLMTDRAPVPIAAKLRQQ